MIQQHGGLTNGFFSVFFKQRNVIPIESFTEVEKVDKRKIKILSMNSVDRANGGTINIISMKDINYNYD